MYQYDFWAFKRNDAVNFAYYLRNECQIPSRDQSTYQTADGAATPHHGAGQADFPLLHANGPVSP